MKNPTRSVRPYEYSTQMTWSLEKKRQKYAEPDWIAIQNLVGTAGRVILDVTPNTGFLGEGEGLAGVGSGEFGSGLGGPGLGGTKTTGPDKSTAIIDLQPTRNNGATFPGTESPVPYDPTKYDENGLPIEGTGGGEEGEMFASTPRMVGSPKRYISVRGVFPFKQQSEAIARSRGIDPNQFQQQLRQQSFQTMGLGYESPLGISGSGGSGQPTYTAPSMTPGMSGMSGNSQLSDVEILDFELERQTAVAGADPWSGPWDKVDIKVAMDVLKEVSDFAPDVVDPAILNDVISMPLPQRVIGAWGPRVTHKDVDNYTLSPEEIEQNNKANAVFLEQWRQRVGDRALPPQKKGFASTQYNMGNIRSSMLSGEMGQEMMQKLQSSIDPENTDPAVLAKLRQNVTAAGNLLLFRFIDFSVNPGNLYRYRVRLVMNNPNFGLGRDKVEHPSVAEHRERKTEWSNPTAPVYVEPDTKFFLTKVDQPLSGEPKAQIDLFHWDTKFGSTVRSTIPANIGQFLGGKTTTEVLDPAAESYEEQEVDIVMNDVLVDIEESPFLTPEDHPDLNLPAKARIKGQIGVPGEALIVDAYGQIRALLPETEASPQKKQLENLIQAQDKLGSTWKKLTAPTDGTGDLLEQQYYEEFYGESGESSGRGRRRSRSSNKRRGGSSSRGSSTGSSGSGYP